MRILFIGPLPDPVTGQSLACKVLHDELVKTHEVAVINLSKSGLDNGVATLSRIVDVVGMTWAVLRRRRWADIAYFTISESKAGNLKDLLIYAAWLGRLPEMLVHLHGGAGMQQILQKPGGLLRRLNRLFLRRLGGVIVLGRSHVGMYEDMVPASRLHIVPNFAQEALFLSEHDIRRKFDSLSPLRLLFLSNLIPGKGHEELLAGYLSLPPEVRARVWLDFAGRFETGADQQAFLARAAGVPGIRYHGVVVGEAKKALFAQSHVFCLPTYYAYEGQPISILEGYATGCAVMTTDHSGIRDIFTDRVNGYLVEKRSSASIAHAISLMLDHAPSIRDIGLANAALAAKQFTVRRYVDDLSRLLLQSQTP